MFFQLEEPSIFKKKQPPPQKHSKINKPTKQKSLTLRCIELSIVNWEVIYKFALLGGHKEIIAFAWQVRGNQMTGFAEFLHCALSSLQLEVQGRQGGFSETMASSTLLLLSVTVTCAISLLYA